MPLNKDSLQNLPHLHPRQLAHHVAFAHLLEHFPHLGVLAEKIVYFLHRSP
jgi:hypothetical protein